MIKLRISMLRSAAFQGIIMPKNRVHLSTTRKALF